MLFPYFMTNSLPESQFPRLEKRFKSSERHTNQAGEDCIPKSEYDLIMNDQLEYRQRESRLAAQQQKSLKEEVRMWMITTCLSSAAAFGTIAWGESQRKAFKAAKQEAAAAQTELEALQSPNEAKNPNNTSSEAVERN